MLKIFTLKYEERTEKIKYELAWILFPILILFYGLDSEYAEQAFVLFFLFAIPAIVIDVIYVYFVYINR